MGRLHGYLWVLATMRDVSCQALHRTMPSVGFEWLAKHGGVLCFSLGVLQSAYFNPRSELLPGFVQKKIYIYKGKQACKSRETSGYVLATLVMLDVFPFAVHSSVRSCVLSSPCCCCWVLRWLGDQAVCIWAWTYKHTRACQCRQVLRNLRHICSGSARNERGVNCKLESKITLQWSLLL